VFVLALAVLLAWTFLGGRQPARALDRAYRAWVVVSLLLPLSVVFSVNLWRPGWSELGGLALGLAVGLLLLLLSLVVNPGLCAVHLLVVWALDGLPAPVRLTPAARRAGIAYGTLAAACVVLARHPPFLLPATTAATVGALGLMAWPAGPFPLRAALSLAGPYALATYALATGAAALVAPVVAATLWAVLASKEARPLRRL
jgi:hypothetical protein